MFKQKIVGGMSVLLLISFSLESRAQEATFDDMEFVRITQGTFTMGSPLNQVGRTRAEKQRQVPIAHDFWIGKYEVSQSKWTSVMGYNPSSFQLGPVQSFPVETVTWYQVKEFITALNQSAGGNFYRLPTEAESVITGPSAETVLSTTAKDAMTATSSRVTGVQTHANSTAV